MFLILDVSKKDRQVKQTEKGSTNTQTESQAQKRKQKINRSQVKQIHSQSNGLRSFKKCQIKQTVKPRKRETN